MQNFSVLFLAAMLFFFGACSKPEVPLRHALPEQCTVYDMKQASCIDLAELAGRLAPYRVVFVGDHHAESVMHMRFADLITLMAEQSRHVMLANEWFTPEDDTALSQYAAGSLEGNFTSVVDWQKKAGYAFDSYAPVYDAVRRANGALYGINMDKAFQHAISDQDETNMTTAQKAFVHTLDMNLSAHRAMLAPFFSHCHAKHKNESAADCSERMYRVQVAWDSYMARQSAVLAEGELKKDADVLIIFAGAMHLAYGVGINARFARLSGEPFVTILPVPEGISSADVGEADFLLFYRRDKKEKDHP